MAYVIIDAKEIAEVLNRLQCNQLNNDDIRLVSLLLRRAQQVAEIQSGAGRLTINQLPVGFDLVK